MAITKATSSSVAPAAKGDLVAGTATNDAAVLGVGANNTVLTADSAEATGLKWATPSSGGMTLLSTTTLSGASVVISSISQDYKDLLLVIGGITAATSNQAVRISPNGDASNSNSRYIGSGVQSSVNERIMLTGQSNTDRTNANNAWSCTISNYASTTKYKPFSYYGFFVDDTANNAITGGGAYRDTTAITSLTFTYSANSFSTGTVLLYGVK